MHNVHTCTHVHVYALRKRDMTNTITGMYTPCTPTQHDTFQPSIIMWRRRKEIGNSNCYYYCVFIYSIYLTESLIQTCPWIASSPGSSQHFNVTCWNAGRSLGTGLPTGMDIIYMYLPRSCISETLTKTPYMETLRTQLQTYKDLLPPKLGHLLSSGQIMGVHKRECPL